MELGWFLVNASVKYDAVIALRVETICLALAGILVSACNRRCPMSSRWRNYYTEAVHSGHTVSASAHSDMVYCNHTIRRVRETKGVGEKYRWMERQWGRERVCEIERGRGEDRE